MSSLKPSQKSSSDTTSQPLNHFQPALAFLISITLPQLSQCKWSEDSMVKTLSNREKDSFKTKSNYGETLLLWSNNTPNSALGSRRCLLTRERSSSNREDIKLQMRMKLLLTRTLSLSCNDELLMHQIIYLTLRLHHFKNNPYIQYLFYFNLFQNMLNIMIR